MEVKIIKKHTIVPLNEFQIASTQDVDLGGGYFISRMPEGLLDNLLKYAQTFDPSRQTKAIHIFEKERFLTEFCIDHRYEGPEAPHQSSPEEESKGTVRRIAQTMQLIKTTALSPEFIIQTQGDEYKVIDALRTNERNFLLRVNFDLEPFTIEDIEKVKILWPKIKDCYIKHGEEFDRIANSLEFFRVGLNNTAWQLRFVFFVIALESLYSTSKTEVAYSLSQRLSWFLGKDSSERLNFYNKAKRSYDIRSKIVHGSTVKKDLRKEAIDLLVDLEEMTRQTLYKILVEDSFLNIFSDKNKLKPYLDNLTLNHKEVERGAIIKGKAENINNYSLDRQGECFHN